MSTSWDPVLLPPGYAYGFRGGPSFDVRIVETDGGGENRILSRDEPVWRWQALRRNFSNDSDVAGLVDWFLARRGPLYGFLFMDPSDFSTAADKTSAPSMLDQTIGYGDGVTTRFSLLKRYRDPGGITARDLPRRVVPVTGTATQAMSIVLGVDPGDSVASKAAVDGVESVGATFMPLSMAVELPSAPSLGALVTWGGYHVSPVRFDNVGNGIEAVITGFQADEAPFELKSLTFDDAVPRIAGGCPYGYHFLPTSGVTELSSRFGAFQEAATSAPLTLYMDDIDNYPTGGPHITLHNSGSDTITLLDSLGNLIGTAGAGTIKVVFVKEDNSGNKAYVIL